MPGLANSDELNNFQLADKVRILSGSYKGKKGSIFSQRDNLLEILLEEGDHIHVSPQDIMNYSRAARRAWDTMRKRKSINTT